MIISMVLKILNIVVFVLWVMLFNVFKKIIFEFCDIFGRLTLFLHFNLLFLLRFFGRLAPADILHDDQTLRAIRENAHGLAGIAGERLWIELQRIAEGRNAGSVLKVMLEQNLGHYLGEIDWNISPSVSI